jgi:hypothetical protein
MAFIATAVTWFDVHQYLAVGKKFSNPGADAMTQ